MSPAALAAAARQAVAAGAEDVHVHPKTPCGQDSLAPRVVAAAVEAIRAVVDVPVGVTTGAWAEPDPVRRVTRVGSWTVLPDHASVNWHEPGAAPGRPVLLHGQDGGAWPVLRLAGTLGLDTRIGLEDTLLLPDGGPARDNAQLIRAAAAR